MCAVVARALFQAFFAIDASIHGSVPKAMDRKAQGVGGPLGASL